MNAFSLIQSTIDRSKKATIDFVHHVQKLIRASPVFGGAIILASIVLGFGPMLWWQFFHQFIDAAYSARGVGTLTSDLRDAAMWIGVLAVFMTASIAYLSQTKALARSIAVTIIFLSIGVTATLSLFPITKSFLILLCILALGFRFTRHRASRIAIGILVFVLAIASVFDLLLMMTYRGISVGGFMEYSGAVMMLSALTLAFLFRPSSAHS